MKPDRTPRAASPAGGHAIRRLGALVACLALASWFVVVPHARASDASGIVHELKFGVLAHDVPDLWSGFSLEDGANINLEAILSPSVRFLHGTVRPALGASINTHGDTSKAYLDARWETEFASGLWLALGIGAAWHDGEIGPGDWDRKWLGSRVLFHIPIEVGWRIGEANSLSLYFDHISNGYTRRYNEGLDTLGIRFGHRFR